MTLNEFDMRLEEDYEKVAMARYVLETIHETLENFEREAHYIISNITYNDNYEWLLELKNLVMNCCDELFAHRQSLLLRIEEIGPQRHMLVHDVDEVCNRVHYVLSNTYEEHMMHNPKLESLIEETDCAYACVRRAVM